MKPLSTLKLTLPLRHTPTHWRILKVQTHLQALKQLPIKQALTHLLLLPEDLIIKVLQKFKEK